VRSLSLVILTATLGLMSLSQAGSAQQPEPACPPPCKICVSEPKHNTKKVFSCKAEEYCLPRCDPLSWLWGQCGCDCGPCCELRVRRRLVVKKVPDCDTWQCVLKDAPPACPAPCAPVAPAAAVVPAAPMGAVAPVAATGSIQPSPARDWLSGLLFDLGFGGR